MWRDFFTLSRREQFAFLILFAVLVVLVLLFYLWPNHRAQEINPELQAWIDQIEGAEEEVGEKRFELFRFDPNKVKVKDLERLGFSQLAIINLLKYREAGGRIRHVRQLAGIYGVDSVCYKRVKAYVVIEQNKLRGTHRKPKPFKKQYRVNLNVVDSVTLSRWGVSALVIQDILEKQRQYYYKDRIAKTQLLTLDIAAWQKVSQALLVRKNLNAENKDAYRLELNSADTAMLVLLKGIGPVLSKRIVAYRKRIGGFYHVNQLGEVYGISPVVLADNKEVMWVDPDLMTPLNIAKASLRKMKQHPYLDFYMAKEIYESRKRGELRSITQFFSSESFTGIDEAVFIKYFIVSD